MTGVEIKYNLTKQTHFILKSPNQNILVEQIIITVRNYLLKGQVKPYMTFLIFKGLWYVTR